MHSSLFTVTGPDGREPSMSAEENFSRHLADHGSKYSSRRGTGHIKQTNEERRSTLRKENPNNPKNKKPNAKKKVFKIGPAEIDNLDESEDYTDDDTEILRVGEDD